MPFDINILTQNIGATGVEFKGLLELLEDLKAIVDNCEHMQAIHRSVALWVRDRQMRHFQKEEDSEGKRWPRLSKLTLALRRGGSSKPLHDTGTLRASVKIRYLTDGGWSVGARGKGAAVHQYGDTIEPKKGKYLYIPVNKLGAGSRTNSSATSFIRLKKAVIPKREYIYLTNKEFADMIDIYTSEVASRGTTYIDWRGRKWARRFAA